MFPWLTDDFPGFAAAGRMGMCGQSCWEGMFPIATIIV